MRILTGFYVYGAICYSLIGLASIAWNDRVSFAAVLIGGVLTTTSYLAQEPPGIGAPRAVIFGMVILGWIIPAACAVRLVFWS